ncbi:MAG: MurR/RpiR family transcriptional regulator [Clostridium sp.]|nr:MurR/RpiR family transcriptional regulator [Clostridium sp.]
MSCIFKIKEGMNCYTDTEIRLANYVLENIKEVINLNAKELGKRVDTSAAAVIRFSKKLGYRGFTAFKVDLAKQSNTENLEIFNTIINEKDSLEVMIKKAEAIHINILNETYELLNNDILKEAIEILRKARRIFLYGIGTLGVAAIDFHLKLSRINKVVFYNQDLYAQIVTSAHLGEEDVVIALSYSGETKEIKLLLNKAKRQGAKIISVTKFSNNSIAKISNYPIFIPCEDEDVRVGEISSRLSTLAIMDLLYLGVIKDGFDNVRESILETREFIKNLDD